MLAVLFHSPKPMPHFYKYIFSRNAFSSILETIKVTQGRNKTVRRCVEGSYCVVVNTYFVSLAVCALDMIGLKNSIILSKLTPELTHI